MRKLIFTAAAALALGVAGSSYAAKSTVGSHWPSAASGTTTQTIDGGTVPGAQPTRSNLSENQVRQAQQELKAAGLYEGAVDGKMGPETKQAVQQFQQQQGLQATGSLDQQTLAALQSNTGASGSSITPGGQSQRGGKQ